MLTRLRWLRKQLDIILDEVAKKTGISIGWLNQIERGIVADVKNPQKKKRLEEYIQQLEQRVQKQIQQERKTHDHPPEPET
ncbi:helix-turn-helix domain-containing protein [Candidatus Woesearchaeota archaeon]|nr:helix-turn-helix domain-containing protein [Candidatus Woesearchaeota archaeon]